MLNFRYYICIIFFKEWDRTHSLTNLTSIELIFINLKNFVFIILLLCFSWSVKSQNLIKDSSIYVMKARIIDGDTILVSDLPEVIVFPGYMYKNKWDYWRHRRLIYNVKKAYPYAKLAAEKLDEIEYNLSKIKTEKQQRKYIKEAEDQLMDEFEDEVKHLTITQGRILMKLIDRETGDTTYYLLKDLKGNISAVFWQAVARVFGSNLKTNYDPKGEDRLIEQIVLMIEAGQL